MKIRTVKPVAPIKLNNHWVYRIDDTIEVDTDELPPEQKKAIEKWLTEKLEG